LGKIRGFLKFWEKEVVFKVLGKNEGVFQVFLYNIWEGIRWFLKLKKT
jgi:hypothetical protein